MKQLCLLSSIAFLGLVSIPYDAKPVLAGCGWGDITCNPTKWTCPPGGCIEEGAAETPGFSSNRPIIPNPRASGEFYTKRIGEHCQWLLNQKGRTDWWGLIQTSAQRDAGNTDSEFYRKRVADHCEWYLLKKQKRTDWWNLVERASRKDAGL